jgi:hypothetical protein
MVMAKTPRYTAAYIIAFEYGMDLAEMAEYRYQPTLWRNPAVYSFGDEFYYAAPANKKMPENYAGMKWEKIAEQYGRPIFRADGTEGYDKDGKPLRNE